MRIKFASIFVDDQEKALKFYTEKAGFKKKEDVPLGDARWLTLVSPQEPNGTELVLEPDNNPVLEGVIIRLKKALFDNKIPFTAFAVDDINAEYTRLKDLGVTFIQEPIQMEPVILAVFDDTCGNLIQIFQEKTKT